MARARRTVDERVKAIDEKIKKKQEEIAELEAQKGRLLHPVSMRAVLTKAKEAGLTPQEVAEKLGIKV